MVKVLKKAYQINPADHNLQPITNADAIASPEVESDGEGDEDIELLRSIQERFAVPMDFLVDEPPVTKPLFTPSPDVDDSEDDYGTRGAIQRRFSAYSEDGMEHNMYDLLHRPAQVSSIIIDSEKESFNSFVDKTNVGEGFLNCVGASVPTIKKAQPATDQKMKAQPADFVEWDGPDTEDVVGSPLKSSDFPKCELAFIDAIKKNRSCQKLLRSKMRQVEARVEELSKLMERVKVLKDFQVACKKRTGRALSQKKDARMQLISVPKLRANAKFNEKNLPAGPPENAHVVYYKEALTRFAINVSRKNWTKDESENLIKGVKQQFQEKLLQQSVDLLSDDQDGSYDPSSFDSVLVSIRDTDIKPDQMRSFLPKVNWEKLAAMYLPGRSGAECEARFLNFDEPSISHKPWTTIEDKAILRRVQQKGLNNWIDIAASVGTNRTLFQCLAQYQRSLNASILKREWTEEEDGQLRTAVETYGESNWQAVACTMEGRTGTQCSNRWLKALHPAKKVVGKWTEEEDIRLKISVALFGPKMWKNIAKFVPGRTQVQCRERWVNSLDPSLSMTQWTEEEDTNLEMAVAEHGYCWSKIAACIPRRTDNQCFRRWKVLFPDEVPVLQAARKIHKALISNFVDRESERPALGPEDFVMPEADCVTASKHIDPCNRKRRRKSSKQRAERKRGDSGDAVSGDICSEKVSKLSDSGEVENNLQGGSVPRKRISKSTSSDDSNVKRKLRPQKKKLSLDSGSVDEPHTNIDKHPTPTGECLLRDYDYPDLQRVTMNPELGVKKVSKLQCRRRHHPVKTIGTAGEGSTTKA